MIFPVNFLLHKNITLLSIICLSVSLCSGCGQKSEQQDIDPTQLTENQTEQDDENQSPWVGRWELLVNNQTSEFRPIIIEIGESSGKFMFRMIAKLPMKEFEKWNLVHAQFTEDSVLLAINTGETYLTFDGTLHGETVLGSLFASEQIDPSPARLIKTSRFDLQESDTQQVVEGVKEFENAFNSIDQIAALGEFIKTHPNNPLIFISYKAMLSQAIDKKMPLEQVQKIVGEVKKSSGRWGHNMAPFTDREIIELTAEKTNYRSLAIESFTVLNELIGEETVEKMRKQMDEYQARLDLTSEDKEEQARGETAVKELLKQKPFYLKLILSLAEFYENNNRTDDALKVYSRLAVLPGVSRSMQSMKSSTGEEVNVLEKTRELWKGQDADFDHYLDEFYEKEVHFFTEKEKPEVPLREGRRILMVELFTGAVCPPCVAGDLALGGVEKMLPAPNFIAVRYHQHIPGPDPLTVAAGEARFTYYDGTGTPTMAFNGKKVENIGGSILQADQYYQEIYPHIKNLISQISIVKLDLEASVQGDVIQIQAKVENVPKVKNNVKLRLLIVDPKMRYAASNGIRFHEMVARDMPGGPNGVLISDGSADIKIDHSTSKMQTEIMKELKSLEKNRGFKFDEMPIELKQIRVIAFVQDDATREILQSAISPVLTISP
ncbi:MAG: hypothetical protein JKY95_17445 [Planctomycetaceae bacterium]|nr:hypothetical protein [Planctomycetaceae bacterium]